MDKLSIKEVVILHALIEVKVKRGMEVQEAFEEAKRQRYKEPLSTEYLDDLYQAAVICSEQFSWFADGCKETLVALQNENT